MSGHVCGYDAVSDSVPVSTPFRLRLDCGFDSVTVATRFRFRLGFRFRFRLGYDLDSNGNDLYRFPAKIVIPKIVSRSTDDTTRVQAGPRGGWGSLETGSL
jgi:hypothetical protein